MADMADMADSADMADTADTADSGKRSISRPLAHGRTCARTFSHFTLISRS